MLTRGATIGSVSGGLVGATDFQTTWAGSGLNITVSAGEAIVPGSSSTTQSGYYCYNASTTPLTPAAASASFPRIDLVYLQVNDTTYGAGSNNATCSIATGTPTSGANLTNLSGAPTVPTSSYALAYVLIPQSASTISNTDIKNVGTQVTIASGLSAGVSSATAGQAIGLSGTTGAVTISINGIEAVNTVATSGTAQTLGAVATTIGNNITLSASCNIAMPTGTIGAFSYCFLQQPPSGTNTWTATFTGVKWAGGTAPTVSTGTSVIDLYGFVSGGTTGTAWYGYIVAQAMQ